MDIQTQESAATISLAKGIDVGKIERELKAMWRTDDDSAGVTRACTMNLVVHANAGDDINTLGDDLTLVNGAHPGRVVVLVADREAQDPRLEAETSVRCRQLGAHQIVCGEQVTLYADGPALATVNTAVAPLLLPDVPVFLWWSDIPHYEDRLFNTLADLADRVVIDSATFDNPHEDTRHLAEVLTTHKEFGHFSDLNWGRLTSWRTLLASFWDVDDYRPFLDKIDRVVVSYDPPDMSHNEIAAQPLLLVGWLASRLGWEVLKGESGTEASWFTLRDAGRDIVVEMRPEPDREGHDAFLSSISLSSQGRASFYIGINWDGPKLETKAQIDGSQAVGRVLFYEQKTAAQRLSREMGILKRDGVYEAALKIVAQMLGTLK
jgi:glucose-6-phosphate dehydrogenase assembly protein OpcA